MISFTIGDRVLLVKDNPDGNKTLIAGATGTIKNIRPGSHIPIGVCWDNFKNGHALSGTLRREEGHSGWYVAVDHITMLEMEIEDDDAADISSLL